MLALLLLPRGDELNLYPCHLYFSFWDTLFTNCNHEIKRCLFLRRKAMTNLDSVWKSRDITLPTKVHLVKAMVFPVAMYWYESWTIKKAEHQRIGAFKLWWWRKLLRVPWTARRSNRSILKEISWILIGRTEAEAEASVLWPPDSKNWLIGNGPNAGKDWGQEERRVTENGIVGCINNSADMRLSKLLRDSEGQGSLVCCSSWGHKQTWLSDWTTTTKLFYQQMGK